MAHYRTEFAIRLELLSAAEKEWWEYVEAELLPCLSAGVADPKGILKRGEDLADLYGFCMVCDVTIIEDLGKTFALITDYDGEGPIHGVGLILQEFLATFGIEEPVVFQWADTCEEPRSDGFGGGACFVTKDGVSMRSAFDLIDEWVKANGVKRTRNYYDTAVYGIGD